jgi:hypothetical protein
MDPTHRRHNDIVVQRRFAEHTPTHVVKQVYAVTYPGHTDRGDEQATYEDAERIALARAESDAVAAWYEETPNNQKPVLLGNFRAAPPSPLAGGGASSH